MDNSNNGYTYIQKPIVKIDKDIKYRCYNLNAGYNGEVLSFHASSVFLRYPYNILIVIDEPYTGDLGITVIDELSGVSETIFHDFYVK